MKNDILNLCDELCSAAGFNKNQLLSGKELLITDEALLSLATAYKDRLHHCNGLLHSKCVDPTNFRSIKKVWNRTLGEHWNLPLKRVTRSGQPVYVINLGAK